MSIRMEWDVPYAGETVPFGDLASFVARAGALGAEANTPVLAATALQDDSVIVAFRVELDEASHIDRQPVVCLDRSVWVPRTLTRPLIEGVHGQPADLAVTVRRPRA